MTQNVYPFAPAKSVIELKRWQALARMDSEAITEFIAENATVVEDLERSIRNCLSRGGVAWTVKAELEDMRDRTLRETAFLIYALERRARDAEPGRDRIHKAIPGETSEQYCGVCGQRIKKVPGGQGTTFVHSDSGAVAAPNPPAVAL